MTRDYMELAVIILSVTFAFLAIIVSFLTVIIKKQRAIIEQLVMSDYLIRLSELEDKVYENAKELKWYIHTQKHNK